MYAELMEYKKEHGHCNVPKKCRANQKLGSWVDYQRTLYRQTIKKNTNSNEGSSISVCTTDNNENAMSTQLYNPNAITPERIKLLEDIGFRWSTAKELSNASTTNVNNKKNKISRNKTKQQQQSCLVSNPDTHSSMNSSTDAPTVISNSSSVNVNGNVNVVPQVKRNASPLELLSMVAASEARNSRNVIQKSQATVAHIPSNTSAFTARMQQSYSMMTSPRTPTQNQHQHQHRIVYTTTAHHPAVSTATAPGGPVLIQQVAAPRYEQQYHSYAAHPIAQHHQQQVVRVVHHYRPAAAHQVSAVMARHPIHY